MSERDDRRRASVAKELLRQIGLHAPSEIEGLTFQSDPLLGAWRKLAEGEQIPENQKEWLDMTPDGTKIIPVRVFGPSPKITIKTPDAQTPIQNTNGHIT